MTTDRELRALALGVLTPGFVGTTLPAWLEGALRDGLAGVWLFGQNVAGEGQVRALTAAVHAAGPHALVCADEEGGTVTRLHHREGSPWPSAWALGRGDAGATEAAYRGLGCDVARAGVDLGAAPVADVNSEPRNPVIGVRSFGADAPAVAAHVAAAVAGLREAGVLSCAKHFPGHGSTRQDSHLTLPVLEVGPAELAARELVPFRAAVDAGVDVIMTGHLVVPGYGDLPGTLNPGLLALLREDLGFGGVICSDALDMAAIAESYGRARGAVLALTAGVDLLCVGNPAHPGEYDAAADLAGLVDAVVAAVRGGELSEQRLREAAARVCALGRHQARIRAGNTGRDDDAAAGTDTTGEHPGLVAARRAIETHGTPASVAGAAVVGASAAGNIASGARQEVMVRVIAEHLGGTWRTLSDGGTEVDPGAPVVAVCDDHTDTADPAVRRLLAGAAAVVLTGVRPLDGAEPPWLVRTWGGGAASARAAAETLRG